MKDSTIRVLQAFTLLCVAVVGLLLNIIVFLVFYKRPALRSSSNRFVLSLVFANFVSVLGLAPAVLYLFFRNSFDCMSHYGSCLAVLVVTASVFSILVIAVDRYNAVLSPLHYSMTITSQRNKETITAIWCMSVLLSAPPLLGVFDKRISYSGNEVLRYSYITVLGTFGFVIPLLALIWVYARMYVAAHKNSERTRRQSIQANAGDSSRGGSMETQYPPIITTLDFIRTAKPPMLSQIHKRRCSNASFSAILFREEGKAVKTAVMVIASFILCWCPFFIALFLPTVEILDKPTRTTVFLGILPIATNSILSPFIYVFRNDLARNEAIRLIFRWKKAGLYEGNVLHQANRELKMKTSDGGIPIQHQSSSNYDSMSVQSFQLPISYSVECKQCAEPSNTPVADFVATYEIVNSREKPQSGSEVTIPESKTKGESVTFRLAFLPQRRCQSCIRQNSDSSSGSAHPLLRESEPPTPIHTNKRHEAVSRVNSGDESQPLSKTRFCDSPKQALLRHDKEQTIVEMEEHPHSDSILKSQGINSAADGITFWTDKESIETGKKNSLRQDSDSTFDGEPDEGPDNSSPTLANPTASIPKKRRHKLERLSAVEDEYGLTKSKTSVKFPPCGFG